MKKVIVSVLLVVLTITSSHAQFKVGVKGGANLSSLDMSMQNLELEIYKPRAGFHAGFMAEYMFSQHFGLHTELMYFNSGANIDAKKYLQGMEIPDEVSLDGHVSMHTFQMPLYMKTKFMLNNNMKLYAMVGAFGTISAVADQHIKMKAEDESIKVKWSLFDPEIHIMNETENNIYMQRRNNMGVAVEVGVEKDRLTFGIGFRKVLNNMAKMHLLGVGEPTIKKWTANVSVGYYF